MSTLRDNNKSNSADSLEVSYQDTSASESKDERRKDNKSYRASTLETGVGNNKEEETNAYLIAQAVQIKRNHAYLHQLGLLEQSQNSSSRSASANSMNRITKRSSPACSTPGSSTPSSCGSTRISPRIQAQQSVDLTDG